MTDPETIFDAAAVDIFNALGRDAVYQPASGDPVSLKVNIEQAVALQPDGYEARVYAEGDVLEYLLADAGKEADRGETFTIGSTTWTVQSVLRNDGRFVSVAVK